MLQFPVGSGSSDPVIDDPSLAAFPSLTADSFPGLVTQTSVAQDRTRPTGGGCECSQGVEFARSSCFLIFLCKNTGTICTFTTEQEQVLLLSTQAIHVGLGNNPQTAQRLTCINEVNGKGGKYVF